MSTAHAEPSAGDHAHDDPDHDHAFDGEPIQTLPEGEPRTPGWLTVLGLLLFVAAGIAYLVVAGNDASPSAASAEEADVPVHKAIFPTTPQGGLNPAGQGARPTAPDGTLLKPQNKGQDGAAAAAKLTPEQLQQLQKAILGAMSAAPAAPPAH